MLGKERQNEKDIFNKYSTLLKQFNEYKNEVQIQKQEQDKAIERYQNHINQMLLKMQKKYQGRLQQLRMGNVEKLNKIDSKTHNMKEELAEIIKEKDRIIQELSGSIQYVENEKVIIMSENKKTLMDLGDDDEDSSQKNTYRQLLQLYQYAVQQNGQLKKEVHENKCAEISDISFMNSRKQNESVSQKNNDFFTYQTNQSVMNRPMIPKKTTKKKTQKQNVMKQKSP